MKKLIATTLMTLIVSPAFAGGIYEAVSANRPTDVQSVSAPAEFNYSPLYRQVTGDWMRSIDQQEVKTDTMTSFDYSPLYLKVTGKRG